MNKTIITCGLLLTVGSMLFFFGKTEPNKAMRAGFSNTVSSQIYFETQYRRGKEYGVWYAKDGSGNITAMQVLPLDR